MRISLDWLNDFVDIHDLDAQDLANRFTLATAEVEGVERIGDNWPGVVTARITAIRPHPDAEKLRLATVTDGGEIQEVVCGAPNIEVGQIIPLAKLGAQLPGGLVIKKAKIRGVESQGMLCSAKELGLAEESSGIFILDPATPLGLPLGQALGFADTVLEVDNKSLTHRPDLWGHLGIAREVAAVFKRELTLPPLDLPEPQGESRLDVDVQEPSLCYRYSALAFEGVRVGPSPEWVKRRLAAVGARSINNVVDASNVVMFELGQPTHAFDRDKLAGDCLVIRRAQAGETMATLDEVERTLDPDILVIADSQKPIALAGIMGGISTAVDEKTTRLVLESANFHPATIRRAALKLGLRTDAAARFEKSLDPNWTVMAIARFAQILKETCPQLAAVGCLQDRDHSPHQPVQIPLSTEFVRQKLGMDMKDEAITDILERLGFGVAGEGGHYQIGVPTWRSTKDVGIAEDLVEEVGRMVGYDHIPPVAPLAPVAPTPVDPKRELVRRVRRYLAFGEGFAETYAYPFASAGRLEAAGLDGEAAIPLANPLSADHDRLVPDLIPNLLGQVAGNLRHREHFRVFEVGVTFQPGETHPVETEWVAGVVVGPQSPRGELFFQAKGTVERLFGHLKLADVQLEAAQRESFHPGRSARLVQGQRDLGWLGEIHPQVADAFGIDSRVAVFLLPVQALYKAKRRAERFEELPQYPHVPFDVAVVVDHKEPAGRVEQLLKQAAKQIQEVKLFDVYEGDRLPQGKKSLAFRVTFLDPTHTLTPKEIENLQGRVLRKLEEAGYSLRQ